DDLQPEFARLEKVALIKTQQRAEPRSVTLLHLTGVLCMLAQGKTSAEVAGPMALLRKAFADVDGSLTLYSQYWKTNVDRAGFEQADLGKVAEWLEHNENAKPRSM